MEWLKKIGDFLWAGPIVILFIVLIVVFGAALVTSVSSVGRWLLVAAVMGAFLLALGQRMSGRPAGILIDSRYKMSLSRFQMVLWTVVVFSAYFTIALPRSLPDGLPDIDTADRVDACIEYLEDQDSEEVKDKAKEIKDSREQDLEDLKLKTAELEALEDKDSEEAELKAAELEALEDKDSEEAELKAAELDAAIEALEEETETLETQYSDETRKKAQEQCTPGQPLNITFPPELIAALGISTASLAGSNLIKSVKDRTKVSDTKVREAKDAVARLEKELKGDPEKKKQAEKEGQEKEVEAAKGAEERLRDAERALADLEKRREEVSGVLASPPDEAARKVAEEELDLINTAIEDTERKKSQAAEEVETLQPKLVEAEKNLEDLTKAQREESSLAKNEKVDQATWGDMFRSEVVGKEKAVDLAKVQMFFFTVVVVFAYTAAIYGLLAKEAALTNPLGVDFPSFSSSLNALLGLSHAGYLTGKATSEA